MKNNKDNLKWNHRLNKCLTTLTNLKSFVFNLGGYTMKQIYTLIINPTWLSSDLKTESEYQIIGLKTQEYQEVGATNVNGI